MKFTSKDLINIGIFTILYMLLAMVVMSVAFTPVLQILTMPIFALVSAPIYLMYIAKVGKVGAIAIMGIICSAVSGFFAFGSVACFLACLIFFIFAELIAFAGKYKNKKLNSLSCIVVSFWTIGVAGLPWTAKEFFRKVTLEGGYSEEWLQGVEALATVPILIYIVIAMIICSILSILFANKLFKKHFQKAGLV